MGDTGWKRLPKRISEATILATADALKLLRTKQKSGFAVVLHGGEPLLVGQNLLEHCLAQLRSRLPLDCSINIQTNGMLVTDELLDLCSRYQTSLSISIDGPANVHDNFRLGHKSQNTHTKVERAITRLRNHRAAADLYAGLLAVIDPTSDPKEVYEYLKDLRPPSIDFIVRDGNHSKLPFGKSSRDTTECGEWLCLLLDVYLADKTPPKIRLLDDMIKLVLGGAGEKEGIGQTNFGIVIIDTDGSFTKNDTLKSTFDGADRFESRSMVHSASLVDFVNSKEFREFHELQQPTSTICTACPELKICGGGMPLHRWSSETGFDNPSVYCADQMLLISHIRERIREHLKAA